MTSRIRWLAAVVATIGLVSLADAQPPDGPTRPGGNFGGRGGRGGPGMMRLITNPAVQDDIRLTDEQKDKLATWYDEFNDKIEEKTKDLGRADFAKRMEIRTEVTQAAEKDLETVLKPEQMTRLKQIGFQAMGPRALQNEDVQKQLEFTDEQKEKLTKVTEEARESMRGSFTPGQRPDMTKFREMMAKQGAKFQEVLTGSQKAKWKEMTGEPFDTSKLIPEGGFGGRGDQPGGGRRPGGNDNSDN